MPISPSDVNAKQFKISRKGYHVDEVDAFLDEIEAELVRLLSDNAALRAQPVRPPAAPGTTAPGTTAPGTDVAPYLSVAEVAPLPSAGILAGETEGVALRTLLLAQQTADAAVAQARAEADEIVAQARRMLTEADADVAAKVAAVLGDLEERRGQLEAQIEDLRAYEREYRIRLKAYFEGQLRDLSGAGATDDAGDGVPASARAAAIGGSTPPLVSSAPAPALAAVPDVEFEPTPGR